MIAFLNIQVAGMPEDEKEMVCSTLMEFDNRWSEGKRGTMSPEIVTLCVDVPSAVVDKALIDLENFAGLLAQLLMEELTVEIGIQRTFIPIQKRK